MSKYALTLSLGISVLAAAGAARAEDAGGSVHLGFRTGYGLPLGKVGELRLNDTTVSDDALSDIYSGTIPLWIDAGSHVTPELMVGAYFAFAYAMIADGGEDNPNGCPEGADCYGTVLRFGAQGEYDFARGRLNPWLGAGVGYEIATATMDTVFFDGSSTASGAELLLEAGLDLPASTRFGIGPMAALSLGWFGSCSAELNDTERDCTVETTRMHSWLVLGVRGTFDL
jgi:hypothetical protein